MDPTKFAPSIHEAKLCTCAHRQEAAKDATENEWHVEFVELEGGVETMLKNAEEDPEVLEEESHKNVERMEVEEKEFEEGSEDGEIVEVKKVETKKTRKGVAQPVKGKAKKKGLGTEEEKKPRNEEGSRKRRRTEYIRE